MIRIDLVLIPVARTHIHRLRVIVQENTS